MAAGPVWTVASSVECTAAFSFVLGVTRQISKLVIPVSELTLLSVFASSVLLEGPAQLGFVTGRVNLRTVFLLQELPQLLAALPALAVRAAPELVLLVHNGCGAEVRTLHEVAARADWILVAVNNRVHVAGRITSGKPPRVRATVGGIGFT